MGALRHDVTQGALPAMTSSGSIENCCWLSSLSRQSAIHRAFRHDILIRPHIKHIVLSLIFIVHSISIKNEVTVVVEPESRHKRGNNKCTERVSPPE